jgi:hypothetical protein
MVSFSGKFWGAEMFRKFGLISAIVLIGIGLVVPAAAAGQAAATPSAGAPTPVCLITTNLTKEMICAELLSRDTARGTFHTVSTASLTVTLEYSSTLRSSGSFVVLATKTVSGNGLLDVTTDPVTVPDTGSVQACATVTELPSQHRFHLCTSR